MLRYNIKRNRNIHLHACLRNFLLQQICQNVFYTENIGSKNFDEDADGVIIFGSSNYVISRHKQYVIHVMNLITETFISVSKRNFRRSMCFEIEKKSVRQYQRIKLPGSIQKHTLICQLRQLRSSGSGSFRRIFQSPQTPIHSVGQN